MHTHLPQNSDTALLKNEKAKYLSMTHMKHINHITYTTDVFQEMDNVAFQLLDSVLHTTMTTCTLCLKTTGP